MLLASTLAVVLMAALYVALDVQLRLAAAGRDALDEATLTRAIVQRMENDLNSGIGPVAPPTGSPAAATGGSTTPATGTPATGESATPAAGDAVVESIGPANTMPFGAGLIGEGDRVTIFVARLAGAEKAMDESAGPDLRRIVYWMTDRGLARQELSSVTRQEILASADPVIEDGKEESSYVIAEEVKRVQFEYWDGSAWASSWDGRTPTDDGVSLTGPPMAVRIRFWLTLPGENVGETVEKEVRHTILIRGGPGQAVPETPAATTTPEE